MHPRAILPGRLASLLILAGILLPAPVRAQAGLSGDPLSGQAEELRGKTPFNSGFKSKSALGQLEELTGTKVDRSAPALAPVPRAPKVSRSAQLNNQFRQEVAGMLADALVQAIFSDDSAKKQAAAEAAAAEAAARAAAEAEALRVQQELARLARIQQAQRNRADWDDRETEIGDRLGGAFTVPTGTDFFGRPAGPDATAAALLSDVGAGPSPSADIEGDASIADSSVVDLRESSLIVPAAIPSSAAAAGVRPPASAAPGGYVLTDNAEPPIPPSSTNQLNALIAYFGPWLGKWYWETVVQGYAKSTAWGRVKNLPGMSYLNAVVGANEQRVSGTEELGEAYTDALDSSSSYASNSAAILANPYSNGDAFINSTAGSVDYQVRKLKVKFSEMVFKGFSDRSEIPDQDDLQTPEGDGNVVPIYGRGAHPGTHNLLFGHPAGT